jgi:hypothetical protein
VEGEKLESEKLESAMSILENGCWKDIMITSNSVLPLTGNKQEDYDLAQTMNKL